MSESVVAHFDNNLLLAASGILHHGVTITDDEEMSPTVERLAVYLRLTLIDECLTAYVPRIYPHDLQLKFLKTFNRN